MDTNSGNCLLPIVIVIIVVSNSVKGIHNNTSSVYPNIQDEEPIPQHDEPKTPKPSLGLLKKVHLEEPVVVTETHIEPSNSSMAKSKTQERKNRHPYIRIGVKNRFISSASPPNGTLPPMTFFERSRENTSIGGYLENNLVVGRSTSVKLAQEEPGQKRRKKRDPYIHIGMGKSSWSTATFSDNRSITTKGVNKNTSLSPPKYTSINMLPVEVTVTVSELYKVERGSNSDIFFVVISVVLSLTAAIIIPRFVEFSIRLDQFKGYERFKQVTK